MHTTKLPINPNPTKPHIIYYRKCKNWSKSDYVIDTGSMHVYGIAGRAASQAWLGMGGQGIGVRGVPGSIPGGTTAFVVSVSNEIG